MNPLDYVIDHADRDWPRLLSAWHDLLPLQFNIFLVNRFGDVVLITADGTVHMLDVGSDLMPQLADDLAQFVQRLPANASNWLLAPLADECVAAGMILKTGECYSWRRLPMLGGAYEPANIEVLPIEEHYRRLGALHSQTGDLPDGTRVSPRRRS